MKYEELSKLSIYERLAITEFVVRTDFEESPNIDAICEMCKVSKERMSDMLENKELLAIFGYFPMDKTKKQAEHIFEYLNAATGKKFLPKGKNLTFVTARIKDGYHLDDFKRVIDLKCSQWKGTSQDKYLRPETLFNETKFQAYVNESPTAQQLPNGSKVASTADAYRKTIGLDWGLDSPK